MSKPLPHDPAGGRPSGVTWSKVRTYDESESGQEYDESEVDKARDENVERAAPFVHPGDAMEPAGDPALVGGDVSDLFRRLFSQCLPSGHYAARMGVRKHWQAGFRRMVAIAYTVTPELFRGMRSEQVAKALGISWWAWRKQLRAVRDMLEERRTGGRPGRGRQ